MIGLAAFALVLWSQTEPNAMLPPASALSQSERMMFERIAAALAPGQPSQDSVTRAFELPAQCNPSCDFDGNLGEVSYSKGSLRPRKDGLILVLDNLKGDCIRLKGVVERFRRGIIEDPCSHGPCWYYTKQFEWGILGFGLKDIDSQCVSSVVINSMPDQRLKQ